MFENKEKSDIFVKNKVMRKSGVFNKEEIVDIVSKLEIIQSNGVIVTKYDGRFLAEKEISKKYESFDFNSYVEKVIDEITKNFEIKKYTILFKNGIQQIILEGDEIEYDNEKFVITFYILNSSDKSRALSISLGLKNKKYSFITEKGTIYKKHYSGINEYVDDNLNLNTDIFKEQLDVIKSLIGEEISLSDIKKVITTSLNGDKILSSQENIFNSFIRSYYFSENDKFIKDKLYPIIYNLKNREIDYNFYLDSYKCFEIYMKFFSSRDSFIIKNESERILKMSKYFKRRNIINMLNRND